MMKSFPPGLRWTVALWWLVFAAVARAAAPAPDFAMTLDPSAITLVPGKSAGFLVSLTPLNGFDAQVTLSVTHLPDGVTAYIAPNPVTLPGTSVITLNAATNAAVGSFDLILTGAGGGLTNTTAGSVTVNFGLLPICYGAFKGVVSDARTGLPLAGATVYGSASVVTDAAGRYLMTNVVLAQDNLPAGYNLQASANDYWTAQNISYAVCDTVTVANFRLIPKKFGTVSGTVSDPDDHPIAGAAVTGLGQTNLTTDRNGAFQSGPLDLSYSNAPMQYYAMAGKDLYWQAGTNVTVIADSNVVIHLVIWPVCTTSVTGSVFYADSRLPARNVAVRLDDVAESIVYSTNTDANGFYTFADEPPATQVRLGYNNGPVTLGLSVYVAGYYPGLTNVTVDACHTNTPAPTLYLQPLPQHNYGTLVGHVYDLETGQALAKVSIVAGPAGLTDSTGAYVVTNIFVGDGDQTNQVLVVSAQLPGYFPGYTNVMVNAHQSVTQDFQLLRQRFGKVVGTVRDSATHTPIVNANVGVSGAAPTGADGRYESAPIGLPSGNQPTQIGFTAYASGFWPASTNTTIAADQTNVVDIDLIKICSGATIVGNVVNALTQKPIAGANVSASSRTALTDTNGNFVLSDLVVGNDNSPIQTTVTATAQGFNPQSRTITIFCGATIVTEFGQPQTIFGAIEGYVTNVVTGLPLPNVFIGSEFGGASQTDTNGYYHLTQVPLSANGADRTWRITAMPTDFAAQTKPVVVSSNQTARLDFGFGASTTDLAVTVAGSPDPVIVGSNLVYTVTLRNNGGPASNVRLSDQFPASVDLVSANITNSAGASFSPPGQTNGVITTAISNFTPGSIAILTFTVTPTEVGTLTNVATAVTDTPDTNPDNNLASVVTMVIAPASTNTTTLQVLGPITFNPQTGLFEQRVRFTNLSGAAANAVRLVLHGLPFDVALYNASGMTNDTPFVQYHQILAPGAAVDFLLEYYRADRLDFASPDFSAEAVASALPLAPGGQPLQLDREPMLVSGRLLIEFATIPGRTYVVQYSTDLLIWKTVVPPVIAAGNRIQWYDDGPPKTDDKPTNSDDRFYRVILLP